MLWFRVENNIAVESTDTDPTGRFPKDLIWVSATSSNDAIGDVYNGTSFSKPESTSAPVVVPQTISKVQAVLALHRSAGKLATGNTRLQDVESVVAAASDPEILLAWENATELDREGVFVVDVAKAAPLNMTDAELDALFTAASKISV